MFVMAGLAIACGLILKFCLHRSNKRLYREAMQNGTVYSPYVT